jgi:hypothetical protein
MKYKNYGVGLKLPKSIGKLMWKFGISLDLIVKDVCYTLL